MPCPAPFPTASLRCHSLPQPAAPQSVGISLPSAITRHSTFSAGGQEQPDDMLFREGPLRHGALEWRFSAYQTCAIRPRLSQDAGTMHVPNLHDPFLVRFAILAHDNARRGGAMPRGTRLETTSRVQPGCLFFFPSDETLIPPSRSAWNPGWNKRKPPRRICAQCSCRHVRVTSTRRRSTTKLSLGVIRTTTSNHGAAQQSCATVPSRSTHRDDLLR